MSIYNKSGESGWKTKKILVCYTGADASFTHVMLFFSSYLIQNLNADIQALDFNGFTVLAHI